MTMLVVIEPLRAFVSFVYINAVGEVKQLVLGETNSFQVTFATRPVIGREINTIANKTSNGASANSSLGFDMVGHVANHHQRNFPV